MHGKSVPLIRQMGTTDCGIACLTMLFQYYGFNIDISEMKARIKIGRNGVSLAKMRDIAEEYGFSFKAYSDYLEEQNLLSNLPVIMCSKENHFVVVSERKHGKYVVLDPVKGKLKMNYADIQNAFLNILVLIRPSGNISYNKIKSDFQVPVNKTKFVIAILLTFIAQSIVLVPSLVIQNIVNVISYNEHDFAIIKYIIVTNSLSEEEIYSCLEMVELREDIEKFPLKLNTYVGENGQNISGGQKQRIAIARALALKPEVIIFDEATSNLDPITEKKICDNLKKLHITQIVITHRLSAVEDADKIYVIDKGKISEFGTYAQLIKVKEGYFAAANK